VTNTVKCNMRRIVTFGLLLLVSLTASALTEGQVLYVGGTVPGLGVNAVGRLDLVSETSLTFESSGGKLTIPYSAIESFEYSREVTRHLGVLPAIAVGLVKQRQHRHFFRIAYRDQTQVSHVALFEVPKQMPRTLQAVLNARVPQICKPYTKCGWEN
jgi:hypothetical protein